MQACVLLPIALTMSHTVYMPPSKGTSIESFNRNQSAVQAITRIAKDAAHAPIVEALHKDVSTALLMMYVHHLDGSRLIARPGQKRRAALCHPLARSAGAGFACVFATS